MASERQALQLLLSNCLNEIEVFGKVQPLVESVMAQQAAEQAMKETIEREKNTTAAVRQLRNDLREEKLDHEEKVRGRGSTRVGQHTGWGVLGWGKGEARQPTKARIGQTLLGFYNQ